MDPILCKQCKKFYGNPSQEGMCSKCYSLSLATKKNLQVVSELASKVPQMLEETKQGPTAPPDRCAKCNKRLNLLTFKCRCELYFCAHHRQPEEHSCTFDFKSVGIRKLSQENPLVQGEKFNRL